MTVSDPGSGDAEVILYTGEFLQLHRRAHWEYISRRQASGAASILAVTDSDELLLVEQYRYPLQRNVLELPAGVVGDEPEHAGESLAACANRELVEETGYEASSMQRILTGPSSPGLSSECSHLMRATGLRRVGEGGGVAGENITVHVVPLAEVEGWLLTQQARGLMICPKIYTGLYFLRDRLPG